MSHVHVFPCIRTFNYIYFDIFVVWYFSDCLPLFLYFSPFTLVASWQLNVSLLCPGTLFVLGHLLFLLLLTLFPFPFGFMMRRPNRTSLRTSHDAAFIRNAKLFCQIFLTLTYPLSLTVGARSHFVAFRSLALS